MKSIHLYKPLLRKDHVNNRTKVNQIQEVSSTCLKNKAMNANMVASPIGIIPFVSNDNIVLTTILWIT
ncbi:hypothetical protein IEQ34_006793 [Dendrobium chrysotoxum]|uniref:Uncharacterized protein n=1 Tax=Dendrobium chrysotoxum TaxID=161865 RepID=A0AAV7H502_DENCH|nr:hypothetical protein IEQ34_006793 [Dendrobium chrysotoxum]